MPSTPTNVLSALPAALWPAHEGAIRTSGAGCYPLHRGSRRVGFSADDANHARNQHKHEIITDIIQGRQQAKKKRERLNENVKTWGPILIGFAALGIAIVTLQADQRAWIAPTGAELDGALIEGSPIRLRILYENSGREPALDTVHRYGWTGPQPIEIDGAGIPFIDIHKVEWPQINPCQTQPLQNEVETGRPIYAPGKYGDIRYVFGDGISQELLNKRQTFFVLGCFTYKAFLRTRHSPYCFFFQPNRDRSIEESTFEHCLVSFGDAN